MSLLFGCLQVKTNQWAHLYMNGWCKMMKKCHKCGMEKNGSEYYKNSALKDGLCSQCKSCMYLYEKEYIKRPRTKQLHKESQRNLRLKNPKARLLSHAKERAKEQNLEFNITEDDIDIPEFCPVLGIPMFVGEGKFHDGSLTIDRVNNNRGYVKGNVAVISWRANSLKGDSTIEEIDNVIEYMKLNLNSESK